MGIYQKILSAKAASQKFFDISGLKQVDRIARVKTLQKSLKHLFILFGVFHDLRCPYLLLEYVVGGGFFDH